jgi:hypothetical protein
MQHLPGYLWVFTFATVAAMVAATVYVLYRGALGAGLGARRAAALGVGAAAVLGGGWRQVA